jgi:alpha-L-fucosidase
MQFLKEMAEWMSVNGDAIYGTRPWKIYGEGPTKAAAGHFQENTTYTPQDIRFTTKGNALYAITLGAPTTEVRIVSLGRKAGQETRPVKAVALLGSKAPLRWQQTDEALVIQLPASLPSKIASSFQIRF